mgnify:FL=1
MSEFHHPRPLTAEQIEALQNVKPQILAEADTFDMSHFEKCGTPSCIAGHLLANKVSLFHFQGLSIHEIERQANAMLGISGFSCLPLFYKSFWDIDLQELYESATDEVWGEDDEVIGYGSLHDPILRAQTACAAIDRYISNTKAHFTQQ